MFLHMHCKSSPLLTAFCSAFPAQGESIFSCLTYNLWQALSGPQAQGKSKWAYMAYKWDSNAGSFSVTVNHWCFSHSLPV